MYYVKMIGMIGMWRAVAASSEHSQQQNIEYFRNNLRGRIQGKNNDLRLLFLEISKLEYLANTCACRDLSSDCNFQVSFLCDKAAVMYDDIDRMQLELTDLDFAIRTSIDDYAEQEQKLAYEHSNLSSLKIRSNIELVGGGRKRKKKCAVPPNQTTIYGFFTMAGLNSVDNSGHLSLKHLVVHSNILRISCFPVCCS